MGYYIQHSDNSISYCGRAVLNVIKKTYINVSVSPSADYVVLRKGNIVVCTQSCILRDSEENELCMDHAF